MLNKKEHLNTTVIYQDLWNDNELNKNYAEKLRVDGVIYKYRLYYKTVWSKFENPNLLSFVMLNPSTANQYSVDPTINNCIKIAKKVKDYKFDGIEVVNIYSLRHPVYKEINKNLDNIGNPKDIDYNFAELKNVVLAWGNKKVTNSKLFELLKNNGCKLFILTIEDESKKNPNYKNYNNKQIRHPDNRAWTRLGGISNAKILEVDKKEYLF